MEASLINLPTQASGSSLYCHISYTKMAALAEILSSLRTYYNTTSDYYSFRSLSQHRPHDTMTRHSKLKEKPKISGGGS